MEERESDDYSKGVKEKKRKKGCRRRE